MSHEISGEFHHPGDCQNLEELGENIFDRLRHPFIGHQNISILLDHESSDVRQGHVGQLHRS